MAVQSLDLHRYGPTDQISLSRAAAEKFVSTNIVHARSLLRELQHAQSDNPLVKEVMTEFARHRRFMEVASPCDKLESSQSNHQGYTGLYLTGDGFLIHDLKNGGVMGGLRSVMALLSGVIAGPGPIVPFGEGCWLSPTTSRLRHFNTTFTDVMDRVKAMSEMIPDPK